MKRTTILSLGYWFSSTNFGMLVHPYKTVRELVRMKGFSPLVFSPLVWMATFWLMAMVGIFMGRYLAELTGIFYPRAFYGLMEFMFWWAVWFLGWWQILVLYLYLRFKAVFQ